MTKEHQNTQSIQPSHGWLSGPVGRTAFAVQRGWLANGWPASEMEGMKNFPLYTNGSSWQDLIWFNGEGGPYHDSVYIFAGVASPLPDEYLFSGGQTAGNRNVVNLTDSELQTKYGVVWPKTPVSAGENLTINWNHTVSHATRGYRYFITKDGWNKNERATRAHFEEVPFASIINMESDLSIKQTQTIKLPYNKTGQHIILSVWMIADTGAGFYSAFDVDFDDDSTEGGGTEGGGAEGGGAEGGGTEGGGAEGGGTEGGGAEGNYPEWSPNSVRYSIGDNVIYNNIIYRCTQAHVSNSGWRPDLAFTLWTPVR